MRRIASLAMILILVAAVLGAQESGRSAMPWDPPVPGFDAGSTLIAVGFWADAVGIGLIAGSSAAYSISFDAGNALFGIGLTSMLFVGNPCLQIGMNQLHAQIVSQGFDVPTENRDKSRLFSRIALGCGIGSFTLGMVAIGVESVAPAIVSLLVGTTGAVFEIWNFYVHRQNWEADMRTAAGVPVQ